VLTLQLDGSSRLDVKAVVAAGERCRTSETVWLSLPAETIQVFDREPPVLERRSG